MPVSVVGTRATIARLRSLGEAGRKAARRAVDQAATAGAKAMIAKAVQETTVRQAALRRHVRVSERTRQKNLTAEITVSASRLAVKDFSPMVTPSGGIIADISGRPGQVARLLRYAFHPTGKGKGRKKSRKQTAKGKRMNWGKSAIFERVPKGAARAGRYPIRLALGASAAGMIGPHLDELLLAISNDLSDRTEAELRKAISG